MNQHKLLRISSRDRDNLNDSTSEFFVNVNNVKPLQIAKSVIVKQITSTRAPVWFPLRVVVCYVVSVVNVTRAHTPTGGENGNSRHFV